MMTPVSAAISQLPGGGIETFLLNDPMLASALVLSEGESVNGFVILPCDTYVALAVSVGKLDDDDVLGGSDQQPKGYDQIRIPWSSVGGDSAGAGVTTTSGVTTSLH